MTVERNSPYSPTLLIIRGNSASGKTTTAREVRRRYGRGAGLIELDYVRRVLLREHGSDGIPTVAPGYVTTMTRAALEAGYHVVLEGILHTGQYGEPLRRLIAEHPGPTAVFWMQVSFAETVRRHQQRAEPIRVTAQQMAGWYRELDLLGVPDERIIPEDSGFEQTVTTILHDSGLAEAAALTPCPVLCPRCAQKRQLNLSAATEGDT